MIRPFFSECSGAKTCIHGRRADETCRACSDLVEIASGMTCKVCGRMRFNPAECGHGGPEPARYERPR